MPVGAGLMEMNEESTFEATQLPFDADKVLEICYHIGNKLGIAMSYSGAGVMRTPQLCWITLVRNVHIVDQTHTHTHKNDGVTLLQVDGDAGSKRSLRLIQGQIVCKYNKIKQDGLMSKEVEMVLKNVMKFAFVDLSAAIATFIIRVKPLQIKAAMEKYGQAEARIASMYLIVGPHCLQRKTKLDSKANDLLLNITTLMPSAGTKKLGCLKS